MPISERAIAAVMGVALVGGCASADQSGSDSARAKAEADDDALVLCARGPSALARSCSVERRRTTRGLVLTLRRPDGAFHRLLVARDGRGLVAADGAEPARVAIVGPDLIEVTLGDERYRLPATVAR